LIRAQSKRKQQLSNAHREIGARFFLTNQSFTSGFDFSHCVSNIQLDKVSRLSKMASNQGEVMNSRKLILSTGLFSVLAFCQTSHAVLYPNPLATSTWTINVQTETFGVRFGRVGSDLESPIIFDNLTFDSSSVGKTYFVTQAQDSDFNALVALLQNGQSDGVGFEWDSPSIVGIGAEEHTFFAPLPAGNNGIDFQGFPIDNISLHFDSVTQVGSTKNYQITFAVNSAPVPEPAAASLGLLGGAAWFYSARKRKA
jgi:hypothetical protein